MAEGAIQVGAPAAPRSQYLSPTKNVTLALSTSLVGFAILHRDGGR